MLSKKNEVVEHFLKDVDEQIHYQPMHEAINEELCWHIEDKAEMYMEYGVAEDAAYEKAVRDMGEPSVLGIELNKAHHLRVAKPLLALVILLTFLGSLGNIADGGLYAVFDSFYFLWGIIVLGAVMWRGYPLLLKYTDKVLKAFFIGLLALFAVYFVPRIFGADILPNRLFSIYSPSVKYGVLQLSIPMMVVVLYRNRRKGFKGIGIVFAYEAVMILLARLTHMPEYSYVPIATMVIACTGIILSMLLKRYFSVGEIKGIVGTIGGTAAVILLFIVTQGNTLISDVQMFINPNAKASVSTAWDDAYNNVLIQELWGRAELFGEAKLTEEELLRYKTSQWYYEDGEGNWNGGDDTFRSLKDHVRYKMQFADELEIEDILPQHYLNNYRIVYWGLKYGMIPTILLLSIIILTVIVMFWTTFQIRNRLGRMTALAGCIAFTVQNVFYFLGNLGFQFGKFGNLPFVSEGLVSITGTMVMAGLILSAYRFDTVVSEERV